jgi:hypothetical protein
MFRRSRGYVRPLTRKARFLLGHVTHPPMERFRASKAPQAPDLQAYTDALQREYRFRIQRQKSLERAMILLRIPAGG